MLPKFLLVVAALFTSTTPLPPPPLAIALTPNTSPEVVVDVVSTIPPYYYLPLRRRRQHRGVAPASAHILDTSNLRLDFWKSRERGVGFSLVSGPPDASNTFKFWISRSRERQDAFKIQNSIFRLPPSKALTSNV
ncbi:hypothetical protein R3P38DRAFT_3240295 [Favolaschia claudopus]|uniref:Legume lectin domain-containing protein n=1 Tax=Favolaschia claudopus TaxID=2862362 RepID=A0AAV9Z704_9AGAR